MQAGRRSETLEGGQLEVGRNDPCPCGSGNKYKKCCLAKEQEAQRVVAPNQGLDAREAALSAVMGFVAEEHPRAVAAAERVFYGPDVEPPAEDDRLQDELVRFAFYALFDHVLDDGRSLGEVFLQRGGPVSVRQQKLIRRWTRARLRLYEVEDVRVEEGLQLRDLWTREGVFVTERSGTRQIKKWDLIAARVAPEDDGTQRVEAAGYILPVRMKQRLLDVLRKEQRRLARMEPALQEDALFRRFALVAQRAWQEQAVSPPMPKLVTAEGDELTFGKLVFDILDLAALRAGLDGHPELAAEEDGAYGWIEEADDGFTRSLGHITVEDDRLVLEVTSRQRAERGRRLLEDAARGALRHRATRYESVEKATARQRKKPRQPPEDEIPPEVAAQIIGRYKQRHYATWPDHPLPALDGRTPRQAARLKKLRPRLEDLLKEMENMEVRAAAPGNPAYDFRPLWTELGLVRPT